MKLLIYSDLFFPSIGGTEKVSLNLALGLASLGTFEVTVVTRTDRGIADDSKLPFLIVRDPTLALLWRLICRADLVHLAGPAMLPLGLALVRRKAVVIEHHGFQTICPNGQMFHVPEKRLCPGHYAAGHFKTCFQCNFRDQGKFRSMKMLALTPLRRSLANRATTNITPTVWLSELLKLSRTKTIFHGLTTAFTSEPPEPLRVTFAFLGRLVSTKGVSVLIEAAKRLLADGDDFVIKIIGSGPERAQLERQAGGLAGNIQFLGHVPDNDLADVLSDVCTVIVPSLAGEVFGLVAAENMLRGKAVIVSDLGSLREIVGTAGITTAAGNTSDLTAAMRRIVRDPAMSRVLGKEARARATQVFGMREMIESHISAYHQAIQSRRM